MLHHRFTKQDQDQTHPASSPTETVLLLITFFTRYFARFDELHILDKRVSPVVHAIDTRFKHELSPFFVRDHVLMLCLQTLAAYSVQKTWSRRALALAVTIQLVPVGILASQFWLFKFDRPIWVLQVSLYQCIHVFQFF